MASGAPPGGPRCRFFFLPALCYKMDGDARGEPSLPVGQPPPPAALSSASDPPRTDDMKQYVTDLWNRELDRLLDLHLEVFFLENAGTITEFAGLEEKSRPVT